MSNFIKVDPEAPEPGILRAVAAEIRRGSLVAFPTETVYGLGADIREPLALARLAVVKERDIGKPFPLLLAETDWAWQLAPAAGSLARVLAVAFWPGPLTLVLPGPGREGIGCRVPNLELTRELLRLVGGPVAAPSANKSDHRSPVRALEVVSELFREIDVILDGGECVVGLESTVLDLREPVPLLRRPGGITRRELRRVIPVVASLAPAERRVPVTLKLLPPGRPWSADASGVTLRWGEADYGPGEAIHLGTDPLAAAGAIWPRLRELPRGMTLWAELPPPGSAWEALRERLLWAAGEDL